MYEECRDESLRAGAARHDKRGQTGDFRLLHENFYLKVIGTLIPIKTSGARK